MSVASTRTIATCRRKYGKEAKTFLSPTLPEARHSGDSGHPSPLAAPLGDKGRIGPSQQRQGKNSASGESMNCALLLTSRRLAHRRTVREDDLADYLLLCRLPPPAPGCLFSRVPELPLASGQAWKSPLNPTLWTPHRFRLAEDATANQPFDPITQPIEK